MGAQTNVPLSKIKGSLKQAAEALRRAKVAADVAIAATSESVSTKNAFAARDEALRALGKLREAEGVALGLGPIDPNGIYGVNDLAASIRACDRLVEFLAAFGPVADRLYFIVHGIDSYIWSVERAGSEAVDLSS